MPRQSRPAIPGAPKFRKGTEEQWARAIERQLEALRTTTLTDQGLRGNALDRYVTLRDLASAGIVSGGTIAFLGGGTGSGSQPGIPGGDGDVDLTAPPALTNLAAAATFQGAVLTWEGIDYTGHAYTRIYRNTVDDFASAALIMERPGRIAADTGLTLGLTYYYWITAIKTNYPDSPEGPVNQTAGTPASPGTVGGVDLSDEIITAEKIATGAIDLSDTRTIVGELANGNLAPILDGAKIGDGVIEAAKLAVNLAAVELVTEFPLTGNFDGRTIYLNGALYQYVDPPGEWQSPTTSVNAGDLIGLIDFDTQVTGYGALASLDTVGNSVLDPSVITSDKIAAGAVDLLTHVNGAGDLAALDFVTALQIANNAVTAGKIAPGAVDLLTDVVNVGDLAYLDGISAAQLNPDAVTTDAIAAGAVDLLTQVSNAGLLAQLDQVTSAHLAAGSVTQGALAAGAVDILTNVANAGLLASLDAVSDSNITGMAASKLVGEVQAAQIGSVDAGQVTNLTTGQNLLSASGDPKTERSTTGGGWIYNTTLELADLGVGPGDALSFSYKGRGAGATHATRPLWAFYNGATFLGYFTPAGTSAWHYSTTEAYLISENMVIPGGATRVQVGADALNGGTGTIYAREFMLVRGPAARPYEDPPVRIARNELLASAIQGQIAGTQVADGAISSAQIAANTIVAGNIAANAIGASEIAAGAVIAGKIAAGAVAANEIAANSITANQIAANAIAASELAANSVTATAIAAGSVAADELAANSVVAGKIAAGAVAADELAANSVVAGKVAADAIGANQIAAGAITTAKLAAGAVDATKIQANSITSNELAAGSVTANEIAAGSITAAAIQAQAITSTLIAANAVVAGKIAAGTIVAGDGVIQNGAITNALIANAAIDTANIINGAIVNALIGDAEITGAKIATATIQGASIVNLGVNTAQIANAAITSAKIGDAEIDTLKLAGNAVTVPAADTMVANGSTSPPTTGSYTHTRYSGVTYPERVLSTSVAAPVLVVVSFEWDYDNNGTALWRFIVRRNGVSVFTTNLLTTAGHALTLSFLDEVAPSGSKTYRVEVLHPDIYFRPTRCTLNLVAVQR